MIACYRFSTWDAFCCQPSEPVFGARFLSEPIAPLSSYHRIRKHELLQGLQVLAFCNGTDLYSALRNRRFHAAHRTLKVRLSQNSSTTPWHFWCLVDCVLVQKKAMYMNVSEILTPNPQCVAPNTTLEQAAQQMKSLDIGLLPICDKNRLIGTVTDRDIAIRGVAAGLDSKTTPVSEVMSHEIAYCFDDESVKAAARLMEQRQIRRLPVLNRDKRLIGIISLGDIAVRTHQENLAGEVLEYVSEPTGTMRG